MRRGPSLSLSFFSNAPRAGNTKTTIPFVTHWAKHGCSPPDVEEVVPHNLFEDPLNPPKEGEEGEGATDKDEAGGDKDEDNAE